MLAGAGVRRTADTWSVETRDKPLAQKQNGTSEYWTLSPNVGLFFEAELTESLRLVGLARFSYSFVAAGEGLRPEDMRDAFWAEFMIGILHQVTPAFSWGFAASSYSFVAEHVRLGSPAVPAFGLSLAWAWDR